ncbi:DUF805 domain-containing protein [Carnobacterium gallinarum]|uniref:DUF805 domain-containing protein n=1 Tax=Carnobacterium gallinarum TaxID=2749 RepID=UPI00068CD84C|nr:DUF805 domain-containing protein [Carnobacterium gallinarum]
MNIIDAYKAFWLNYVNFNGRASRSEYWWPTAINMIISSIFNAMYFTSLMVYLNEATVTGNTLSATLPTMPILGVIFGLAVVLPSLSLLIRRLHDTNKSGWLVLLAFIPFIGAIIIFVFTVLAGDQGDNPYGSNPLKG